MFVSVCVSVTAVCIFQRATHPRASKSRSHYEFCSCPFPTNNGSFPRTCTTMETFLFTVCNKYFTIVRIPIDVPGKEWNHNQLYTQNLPSTYPYTRIHGTHVHIRMVCYLRRVVSIISIIMAHRYWTNKVDKIYTQHPASHGDLHGHTVIILCHADTRAHTC